MIYVEEKDFRRQIDLLVFVAESQELDICAWLYPESTLCELAGFKVTDNPASLVPITTYENGFSPKCTECLTASVETINSYGSAHSELKKNCDSLALYRNGQSPWVVATRGHEGMCLVQDDSLLNSLTQAGYAASTTAPEWW